MHLGKCFQEILVLPFSEKIVLWKTCSATIRDGPDPTRAYFWPATNKKLSRLWPQDCLTPVLSDPTRRDFFDPRGKKLKNLTFLGEIFQIQTQTINGWPDLNRVKNFWPGPITNHNKMRGGLRCSQTNLKIMKVKFEFIYFLAQKNYNFLRCWISSHF